MRPTNRRPGLRGTGLLVSGVLGVLAIGVGGAKFGPWGMMAATGLVLLTVAFTTHANRFQSRMTPRGRQMRAQRALLVMALAIGMMVAGSVGVARARTSLEAENVPPQPTASPEVGPTGPPAQVDTETTSPEPASTRATASPSPDSVATPSSETAASGPTHEPSDPPSHGPQTALALLGALEVKGRAPKTGYDREGLFGPAWQDVDANGCDTRNDILGRDLTETVVDDRCRVLTGVLEDPYTGASINFQRGQDTSAMVQVDHVVALMDAWQKGAQRMTDQQRLRFANDPLNLLAVDGTANQQKGAGDAATWLPANKAFRCQYVARQVSVKATYDLWITSAEKEAIQRVLAACPTEPVLDSEL